MAIDLNKDYTIKNEAGLETEVPGRTLIERALANEPDTVNGQPIREFVRANVDVEDSIKKAHDQTVQSYIPLPDPKVEAERIANIRQLELQIAAGVAASNEEDDNLPDPAGDVTDNRDLDTDGVPDRLQEPSKARAPRAVNTDLSKKEDSK